MFSNFRRFLNSILYKNKRKINNKRYIIEGILSHKIIVIQVVKAILSVSISLRYQAKIPLVLQKE